MKTPTIGYEDDTTLARSEIARLQLVEAVSLFVAAKFLPALTLAGAAEEILGKLLLLRSELPVVKKSAQAIVQLREKTGLSIMDGKSEKELIGQWNAARNLAKHLVGPESESITLNLCDEAYWMVRRALENAAKLQINIENSNEFENWFIINIAT
jgi:hypothetical protein